MIQCGIDAAADLEVTILDHIDPVRRDPAFVERIGPIAAGDDHGVERTVLVGGLHDVGAMEETAVVLLAGRSHGMPPEARQLRQLPVRDVGARHVRSPDIASRVTDIQPVVQAIPVAVQNGQGRGDAVHQIGVHEGAVLGSAAAHCFPDQLAGLGVDDIERIAFRVVGADAAAIVLIEVVAAAEGDGRLLAGAGVDLDYARVRERIAQFGKVAVFLDLPQKLWPLGIADVQRIVCAAATAQAEEQPGVLTGLDRAVGIGIVHPGHRRTIDHVRVFHFIHHGLRHEPPGFFAALLAADGRVAQKAHIAVVGGHRDVNCRIARGVAVSGAVVQGQRPRVQGIGHDPAPLVGGVAVAIEVVEVHTAGIGDEFFSLAGVDCLQRGLQRVGRSIVGVEVLQPAAVIKVKLSAAICIALARKAGWIGGHFLSGAAAGHAAAVAAGDFTYVRVRWRQGGGIRPVGQRIEAEPSVGANRRVAVCIHEGRAAGIEPGHSKLLDITGPEGPGLGVCLEQCQIDVVHDFRPVEHIHRHRRGDEGGAHAQDLTEDIVQ